jgi:nitrous oxidase accessory protein
LFLGNTKAIYGESAIRINIHNNDFIKNGWAMQMMSSSELDTITYNNFISNTFNISTNQNARNYNLYENNYWSDYSGYDLDNDGIGDVPHRPVKFFSQVLGYTPEAIILLRSFFIELLNFIENIVPVLTPDNLKDVKPMVKKIDNDSVPRHI